MWLYIATRKGKEFRASKVTHLSVDHNGDAFYIEFCERGKDEAQKIMVRDQTTVKFGTERPEVS